MGSSWAETMDRCSAGNLASMKDHDWAETMDRCLAGYLASMMESSWAETMDRCSAGDLALMMESSWARWRRWSESVWVEAGGGPVDHHPSVRSGAASVGCGWSVTRKNSA